MSMYPLDDPKASETTAVSHEVSAPVRVLVVDDHPMIREIVRLACEDRPDVAVVGEACDGSEALIRCRELRPDVVVLDLTLPGMDGLQVAAHLRRESPMPKILVLTARDDRATILEAIRAGVDGYLSKSVSIDQIGPAIVAVASGTQVFSSDHERLAQAQVGYLARRARDAARAASTLTRRERQVLGLIGAGLTNRQIASTLGVTERTTETHVANLYRKLQVRTRVQAVHHAASLGLIDLSNAERMGRSGHGG